MPEEQGTRRFDDAVGVLLDTASVAPLLEDFWAYCDGEIDLDELRRRMR